MLLIFFIVATVLSFSRMQKGMFNKFNFLNSKCLILAFLFLTKLYVWRLSRSWNIP